VAFIVLYMIFSPGPVYVGQSGGDTKRRALQMMQHLKIALENKVKVIVITRHIGDFKDKDTSALQGTMDLLKVTGLSLDLNRIYFPKICCHIL
jgi:hypothetical protein